MLVSSNAELRQFVRCRGGREDDEADTISFFNVKRSPFRFPLLRWAEGVRDLNVVEDRARGVAAIALACEKAKP
jgi:hypothetical protein